MLNEQLLSGSDLQLKVRTAPSGRGVTLMLLGRESGVTILLSDEQARSLLGQLSEKFQEVPVG